MCMKSCVVEAVVGLYNSLWPLAFVALWPCGLKFLGGETFKNQAVMILLYSDSNEWSIVEICISRAHLFSDRVHVRCGWISLE